MISLIINTYMVLLEKCTINKIMVLETVYLLILYFLTLKHLFRLPISTFSFFLLEKYNLGNGNNNTIKTLCPFEKVNKKPKRLENSQLSKAANEGVLRNRCSRRVLSLEN